MSDERKSLKPIEGARQPDRRRIGWRGKLALVVLPTVTVLAVLGLFDVLGRQRLLFASFASSACLIYLDPRHGNAVRTLVVAQLSAAGLGLTTYTLLCPGTRRRPPGWWR